jgi:hypothetical protein
MKKKNDKKFMYGIKKLALDFKNSTQTSNYQEIEDLIVFAESFFSENDGENDEVFNEVALLFHQITEYPLDKITMETHLENDLEIYKTNRGFLRLAFNDIIKFLKGKRKVNTIECKKCLSVKDCVKLIKSKL